MSSDAPSSHHQRFLTDGEGADLHESGDLDRIREIHALTPRPLHRAARRDPSWSSQSTASSEGYTTMSREFNALVLAGTAIRGGESGADGEAGNLGRIREEDHAPPEGEEEDPNPLAIVPDAAPASAAVVAEGGVDPWRGMGAAPASSRGVEVSRTIQRVKEEEVETKIMAWQTAKMAKVNNRFKREEAIIKGWEGEKVEKATSRMKKVERKVEEQRARATEKMQNEVAKARRKAEERRASAEGKRGTKVAKVIEVANLMRAVGRPPAKRSFF